MDLKQINSGFIKLRISQQGLNFGWQAAFFPLCPDLYNMPYRDNTMKFVGDGLDAPVNGWITMKILGGK